MAITAGREQPKKLFRNYMEVLFNASGLEIDNDNYAEWDELIDGIIEQTKAEIKNDLNGRV